MDHSGVFAVQHYEIRHDVPVTWNSMTWCGMMWCGVLNSSALSSDVDV